MSTDPNSVDYLTHEMHARASALRAARVIGFGGGILIGDAGELPIRAIPLSTIIALEPVHPKPSTIDQLVEAGEACGQHDRPLPCVECA